MEQLQAEDVDDLQASPDVPARICSVHGNNARALGVALARVYRRRLEAGLERARGYYTVLAPVTCSMELWRTLSGYLRAGVQRSCPNAAMFLEGLEQELGWDVYQTQLDFEIYTLELHRRTRVRKALARSKAGPAGSGRPSSGSSSDASSSGGSSSSLAAALTCAEEREGAAAAEPPVPEPAAAKEQSIHSGRCTGFGLSEPGGAQLVAQTVDLPGLLYGYGDFDCVLRLRTASGCTLAYDTDGRLCPIGLNSAGLGVGVFNLHQTQTEGFEQPSVSVQALVWELLLGGHTLASAEAFLRELPVPPMCGSALVLTDASGAVIVELSPAGACFCERVAGEPTVRANHALHPQSAKTFGESGRACADSRKRQRALTEQLERWGQLRSADDLSPGCEEALAMLRGAKKVRNQSSLAAVACDLLRGELRVEFRERQEVSSEEIARLAVKVGMAPEKVESFMSSGAIQKDAGRERLQTGLPAAHTTRWAAQSFFLSTGRPGPSGLQARSEEAKPEAKKTSWQRARS
ncbi:unnamed protein product [Prorocentrum cordatum]|uniref:Peptidase C45 hydrolase domain-containing protein n=1 Tax=Prorocentrum cordatum TaxID=2364126 RepID=A0ABN9VTX4_9DINO|nr:unnamed protein product [Polarella glacialis]